MALTVNFFIKINNLFVRLVGKLDQETAPALKNKLADLIPTYKICNLILNLKDLSFMDSTGIGLIIGRYNELRRKNGKIILSNINKNVERIVLLSGLTKICELKNTEEEALYYLEGIKDGKYTTLYS